MRKALSSTLILMVVVAIALPTAWAEVPNNINVQGRLTDGAGDPAAPGLKNFTFKIFDLEAAGTEIWPAGPGEVQLLVTDAQGLWSAILGTNIPLTAAVFQDSSRWLEVTVDDGFNPPETLPRMKLSTSPYSGSSAHAERADSIVIFQSGTANPLRTLIQHSPSYPAWGMFYEDLPDDFVFKSPFDTALLVRLGAGEVVIPYTGGPQSTRFSAQNLGDASAQFHSGAVNSDEMLNEPGIAQGTNPGSVNLAGQASMIDVVTVSITTPSAGYIVVEASGAAYFDGTITSNYIRYQIDETAGGSTSGSYYHFAGLIEPPNLSRFYIPLSPRRTYMKPAGTYTFRLEAQDPGGTGNKWIFNPVITATFFPTSYGAVSTVVASSEAGAFSEATAVAAASSSEEEVSLSNEQDYLVDLRELEVRAAHAKAEAERAQRELIEAQLSSQQDGSQMNSGRITTGDNRND